MKNKRFQENFSLYSVNFESLKYKFKSIEGKRYLTIYHSNSDKELITSAETTHINDKEVILLCENQLSGFNWNDLYVMECLTKNELELVEYKVKNLVNEIYERNRM